MFLCCLLLWVRDNPVFVMCFLYWFVCACHVFCACFVFCVCVFFVLGVICVIRVFVLCFCLCFFCITCSVNKQGRDEKAARQAGRDLVQGSGQAQRVPRLLRQDQEADGPSRHPGQDQQLRVSFPPPPPVFIFTPKRFLHSRTD